MPSTSVGRASLSLTMNPNRAVGPVSTNNGARPAYGQASADGVTTHIPGPEEGDPGHTCFHRRTTDMLVYHLLVMIILGLISAVLSYKNKNAYVEVFDDILGREEEEDESSRVGRGFLYGFFFPVYFILLLFGLLALVCFLIAAGIIAAIAFAIVWGTEKVVPHELFGNLVSGVLSKLGVSGSEASTVTTGPPAQPPTPSTDSSEPAGDDQPSEPDPDAGINVTRRHTID